MFVPWVVTISSASYQYINKKWKMYIVDDDVLTTSSPIDKQKIQICFQEEEFYQPKSFVSQKSHPFTKPILFSLLYKPQHHETRSHLSLVFIRHTIFSVTYHFSLSFSVAQETFHLVFAQFNALPLIFLNLKFCVRFFLPPSLRWS